MSIIEVITNFPIAIDSPDHLMPHGTRQESPRDPLFVRKLHLLFQHKVLRVLDLGCAGGGLVRDLINSGDIAVGLEGSDWSKKMQREAWPIVSKFLFTCDITKPFEIKEDGALMKFDVVTSWEVMEHIKTEDIPRVLQNIKKNLKDDGFFIGSIDTTEDVINGVTLHQTVKSEEWWTAAFKNAGFYTMPSVHNFFGQHFLCRSSVGFNIVCGINPSLALSIPKESLQKKMFEAWSGSWLQKILQRMVDGL